jgi:tetratricopeptide (TPR) repeat protein
MLPRFFAFGRGVRPKRKDRGDPLERKIMRCRKRLAACPPGHRKRADVCESLVRWLHQRFAGTGSIALLDEVITLEREALVLRPAGYLDSARACNNLASSLWTRYEMTGSSEFLDETIMLHREALSLRPVGHPDRSMSCNNLAIALQTRYKMTGSSDLLDESITLHREALSLRPVGRPDRSMSYINLANALQTRYEMTGSSDLLDETITLHREALALCPAGHPYRSALCNNLANTLRTRYKVTGSSYLLDEAITLLREALALCPAGHPLCAGLCNGLANAIQARYEMTGSSEFLDETIMLHREALSLRPVGHPDRSMSCNNLANALQTRYEMTGSSDLLDESITLHREALSLRPAGHPLRPNSCSNLASALWTRYEMTGRSDLLDATIMLHREALALRPVGHPDRDVSCNNLANALQTRYKMTGSSDLINEAIMLHREALALCPAGHPDRFMSCNNLANALQTRYEMTGSRDRLDETIMLYREALALCPAGHPDRSMSCNNLASALQIRYEMTGSSDLLDESIMLYREALALRPAGHPDRASSCNNLAGQLLPRFRNTSDVTVIDEALALARESAASLSPSRSWMPLLVLCHIHLESDSPHLSISTATQYLSQASALYPNNITSFTERMQSCLAFIWVRHSDWTADIALLLLNVYSNLIDRLSRLIGFALDTASQLAGLKSARSFGSDACMAALLSGRPSQAIEQIDHAHGVVWAQALHQRNPQLQDIPRGIASELESLLRAVSVPVVTDAFTSSDSTTRYLSGEDIRHQQNSRIQTILTEVRDMPGLDRFMLGKTYVQLRETAREHPVVVLVSAHGYAYALIIRNSVQEHPDEIRLKISSDRLALLRDAAARAGLRNRNAMQDIETESERYMGPGRFEDTALGTLADLWQEIVKPVLDHLQLPVRIWPAHLTNLTLTSAHQRAKGRAKPRLHWCPTGDFAFLPIHAAGIYAEPEDSCVCCSDYVVSSYTPTLSALLNAQNKAPQTAPAHLNMLAVAEDGRGPGSTVSPLCFVEPELTCVGDTATASEHDCRAHLMAKGATIDGVAERIQTAHFVHLACHGTQDQTSALKSGFYLSDGLLTVSKLMNLNLDKAWFAYLSACETAKGDEEQPDQVVHLAAAMLHAGFKSVVATIWQVTVCWHARLTTKGSTTGR